MGTKALQKDKSNLVKAFKSFNFNRDIVILIFMQDDVCKINLALFYLATKASVTSLVDRLFLR